MAKSTKKSPTKKPSQAPARVDPASPNRREKINQPLVRNPTPNPDNASTYQGETIQGDDQHGDGFGRRPQR